MRRHWFRLLTIVSLLLMAGVIFYAPAIRDGAQRTAWVTLGLAFTIGPLVFIAWRKGAGDWSRGRD